MPLHRHVSVCIHSGGPISSYCSCWSCTLDICSVCGGVDGGLTTDCCGEQIGMAQMHEVYGTTLDYTDERGWHRSERFMQQREPRFEPSAEAEKAVAPAAEKPVF